MQEGHGMCVWADGTEYKGTWKGGVRYGRGIYTRPDGYVYDGDWRDDMQHGQGSCRYDDGSRCHFCPTLVLQPLSNPSHAEVGIAGSNNTGAA